MLQKIIEYLNKNQWTYRAGRSNNILLLPLTGKNGTYNCAVDVSESVNLFAFISFLGVHCPLEKREDMVKLINAINNALLYGNFEINPDGDIKFRTSIHYDGIELTDKVIDNVIIKNVYNIDFAAPHFSKFMFGSTTKDEVFDTFFPSMKLTDVPLLEDKPSAS